MFLFYDPLISIQVSEFQNFRILKSLVYHYFIFVEFLELNFQFTNIIISWILTWILKLSNFDCGDPFFGAHRDKKT